MIGIILDDGRQYEKYDSVEIRFGDRPTNPKPLTQYYAVVTGLWSLFSDEDCILHELLYNHYVFPELIVNYEGDIRSIENG